MNTILSPEQLWGDYCDGNLNPRKVFKNENDDGTVTGQLFIDGRSVDGSVARISLRYAKPLNGEELPAVVLLGGSGKNVPESERYYWAKNGYIALSVDYSACDTDNRSTYPAGLGYCAFGSCGRYYDHVDATAADTVWYNWAYSVRRAVYYLLSEEKSSSVSLVAWDDAAKIAMMVLGVDKRLSAGAVLFGNIWENCKPEEIPMDFEGDNIDEQIKEKDKSESESLRRLTGVAPQTYAEMITVPLLVMIGTNSLTTDIFHTYETAGRMKELCSVCLVPRGIDTADTRYVEYIHRWLKKPQNATTISVDAVEKDGSLVLRADLKNLSSVSDVKIYYRRGEGEPSVANWTEVSDLVRLFDACEGVCDVTDTAQPIEFFCNAVQMGQLVSSKLSRIIPEKIGNIKLCERTRILYKGKQGTGEFISLSPMEKQDIDFLNENTVTAAVGPYEVSGVKGKCLSLFSLNDQKYIFDEGMTFNFDVYVKEPCEMAVYITYMWGTNDKCIYKNVQKLVGGDLWQKISVPVSELKLVDGKQNDGALKRILLSFCCKEEMIINNLLVI